MAILVQLLLFVGLVFLAGFLVSLINRLFYAIVKRNKIVCYATGCVGTPIHELSHALFCLLFFHKITEIKLFQINDADGVLGYVNHSYNRRNPYQLMGNYFIGIAPILCGSAIIYVATRFLLPDAYGTISAHLDKLAILLNQGLSWDLIGQVFVSSGGMIAAIFGAIVSGIKWWIYIVIVFCIALHMNMSGADIKGSLMGLPFVLLIMVVLNLIIGFCSHSAYTAFCGFINTAGVYVAGTLLLSIIFSLITLPIGGLIRGIMALVGRGKRK